MVAAAVMAVAAATVAGTAVVAMVAVTVVVTSVAFACMVAVAIMADTLAARISAGCMSVGRTLAAGVTPDMRRAFVATHLPHGAQAPALRPAR